MSERKSRPYWEEGSRSFQVVLPAEKTTTGRGEAVNLELTWKVRVGAPLTDSVRLQWDIDQARDNLRRAANRIGSNCMASTSDADDLSLAVAHGVDTWCRKHLERVGPIYLDSSDLFYEKAPQDLQHIVTNASTAVHRMRHYSTVTPADAVAAVRIAVDALLDSDREFRE